MRRVRINSTSDKTFSVVVSDADSGEMLDQIKRIVCTMDADEGIIRADIAFVGERIGKSATKLPEFEEVAELAELDVVARLGINLAAFDDRELYNAFVAGLLGLTPEVRDEARYVYGPEILRRMRGEGNLSLQLSTLLARIREEYRKDGVPEELLRPIAITAENFDALLVAIRNADDWKRNARHAGRS